MHGARRRCLIASASRFDLHVYALSCSSMLDCDKYIYSIIPLVEKTILDRSAEIYNSPGSTKNQVQKVIATFWSLVPVDNTSIGNSELKIIFSPGLKDGRWCQTPPLSLVTVGD
jgi:hypothetical protein